MMDGLMAGAEPLFAELQLGGQRVPNRVFMAPLTRNRAHTDGTPHELAATYYGQRASAGLIGVSVGIGMAQAIDRVRTEEQVAREAETEAEPEAKPTD